MAAAGRERIVNPSTQLRRDPFARQTLMRHNIRKVDRKSCRWCGNRPGRFCYFWEGDSIGCRGVSVANVAQRGFCSLGCAVSYGQVSL